MALIKCKECSAEISEKAKGCPKCGAQASKKTSVFSWIVTIILGLWIIGYLTGANTNSSTALEKTNEAGKIDSTYFDRQRALSGLIIDDKEIYIKGDYMYYQARIINEYNKSTVKNVKVRIEWVDDSGTIIDTDWTYAIDSVGLQPKAAKSFQIMTALDKRVKTARSNIIEEE